MPIPMSLVNAQVNKISRVERKALGGAISSRIELIDKPLDGVLYSTKVAVRDGEPNVDFSRLSKLMIDYSLYTGTILLIKTGDLVTVTNAFGQEFIDIEVNQVKYYSLGSVSHIELILEGANYGS